MKVFIKSIAIVVLMLVAFVGGRMSAYPGIAARFNKQIAFVQANKTWQYFHVLREVQADLEKGCSQSANDRVKQEIETGSMFLAEHVQAYPGGALAEMIERRDPKLLAQLRSQPVDWSRTYPVPTCSPSDALG